MYGVKIEYIGCPKKNGDMEMLYLLFYFSGSIAFQEKFVRFAETRCQYGWNEYNTFSVALKVADIFRWQVMQPFLD